MMRGVVWGSAAVLMAGCAFAWDDLDPRLEMGGGGAQVQTGGAGGTGGAGTGGATTSTGGGGSTSSSGGGGMGGGGMGGMGGMGGAPPTGPTCNGFAVTELMNGVSVFGSTLQAPVVLEAACSTTAGGEIVYAFTLDAPGDAIVDTDLPGTTYDTVLHVREGACEDVADEVGCLDRGAGDTLTLMGLNAGTYFVIVDSHAINNEGSFELAVSW